ncbi:MAG: ATP-dependent RecD-like DNA helicase [Planctomycetes bacterium]|nr:ATP-dependent RecD-like DNA helicase [Planctomycetota bacterium]
MEELRGSIARFVWQAPDRSYAIARVDLESGGSATVVGDLSGVQEGEEIRAKGQFQEHAKFGRQFRADSVVPTVPRTLRGVRRYLASGMIPGIGPTLAERIVETLGENALQRLRDDPSEALRVEGVGEKKAREIQAKLREVADLEEVQIFLQGLNLGAGLVGRILRRYGADAIRKVKEDPYRLAAEVEGIGFRIADRVASELGIKPEDARRTRAAIVFVLQEASAQGHCFLPTAELSRRAIALLGERTAAELEAAFETSAESGAIALDRLSLDASSSELVDVAYLETLHRCERAVARQLRDFARRKVAPLLAAERLRQLAGGLSIELDPRQSDALELLSREPIAVLTGGPGVGKTTILRLLILAAEEAQLSYALAAPTGRAARRLAESTGREASTLHRLLRFEPVRGRFLAGPKEPLEQQLVVVDEVSMTDLQLFYNLLRALRPPTRLVLVGDADQLPSVGPGAVLRDLVRSACIPTARLQRIFRQGAGSRIVSGAHAVLNGEMPEFPPKGVPSDLFLWPAEGAQAIADAVCELASKRIPERFGFDRAKDVQVLSPMYRGACGVDELNRRLRELLNPVGPTLERGGKLFRAADKVIQLRNDYDREVFNGDVGRIADVSPESGTVTVAFDEHEKGLEYRAGDLDDLAPAYAITVHRAQGSEYPVVIFPLAPDHTVMLKRNLVYTALTRGRKLVVLVGQRETLRRAIASIDGAQRFTGLEGRLRHALGGSASSAVEPSSDPDDEDHDPSRG